VPDQRDIAQALPILQRATGAMLAAAQGPDRAVVLGDLQLDRGCRITPIRDGVEATRVITVHVQAGQARAALEAIAAALPADYRPDVAQSDRGTRVGLRADAGGYVGIDADTLAGSQVFTLEASTACRPAAPINPSDPAPAAEPAVLPAALRALGARTARPPTVRTVACPGGGSASTYVVDNVAAPRDLGAALQPAIDGATVVRSDPRSWAYVLGGESVVVTEDGGRLQVSATTPCR
jgi:hypothetical protein